MIRLFLVLIFLAAPALADPSITVAFSPRAGATETIVRVIGEAKRSIHVAAYALTSQPIARALVEAHQRGVDVEAVLDGVNATTRYTAAAELVADDVPVRIDSREAIMHDKFLVVDGITVETGSFNFTSTAENGNAENVLVLREYPEVARQYEANWQRLWAESRAW